jgi:hypothetical protein
MTPLVKLVEVNTLMTENDLKGIIRGLYPMVKGTDSGAYLSVSGYDSDPREVYDIPEVVELFKKCVKLGLISLLECTVTLKNYIKPSFEGFGIAAFEVWWIAKGGKMNKESTSHVTKETLAQFIDEWLASNAVCDRVYQESSDIPPSRHYIKDQNSIVVPGQHRVGFRFEKRTH